MKVFLDLGNNPSVVILSGSLKGVGGGVWQKNSLDPSFCHIKVLIKTNPKWAQPPLNSKQLTFYCNLNICKFDPDYKGYYGKNEKKN